MEEEIEMNNKLKKENPKSSPPPTTTIEELDYEFKRVANIIQRWVQLTEKELIDSKKKQGKEVNNDS